MLRKSSQQPEWVKILVQEMLKPPEFLQGIMQEKQEKKQGKKGQQAGTTTTEDGRRTQSSPTEPGASASRVATGNPRRSPQSAKRDTHSKSSNHSSSKRTSGPRPTLYSDRRENHREETEAEDWVPATASQIDAVEKDDDGDWRATLRHLGIPPVITKQYGWKVTSAKPVRNIVQVTTDKGAYALKAADIEVERIMFLDEAEKHLRQRGFTHLARFALTKQKHPYVRRDEQVFYATRWIEGRPVRFGNQEDVAKTARALAEFHEASQGFESSFYNPPMEFNLQQMFKHRYEDLKILLAQADAKTNKGTFDKLLLSMESRLRKDAEESLNLLDDADCNDYLLHREFQPGLCHLDVIPSNFMYDKTGNVNLLDLDLATYAPRVLDIGHLLRRSLQVQNWNSEVAYACFLNFDKVRSIVKEEYILIEALLRFPYRAWRLTNTRYRVFAESGQVQSLKRYHTHEDNRQQFLRELAQQIR